MPGLVPGIHVLAARKDVDGRDKPGHDDFRFCASSDSCNEALPFESYEALRRPNGAVPSSNKSIVAPTGASSTNPTVMSGPSLIRTLAIRRSACSARCRPRKWSRHS